MAATATTTAVMTPLRCTFISSSVGKSSHAKIRPFHLFIRKQRVVRAFEHEVPGLEHVAIVAGAERLRNALLDEEHRDAGLAMDLLDALENLVRQQRCE